MSAQKLPQILDWVIQEKIPSNLSLTERIMKEARQSPRQVPPLRLKLSTSLVIAIAALILLSSAVYAVYRLIVDPGLQSIQQAGLATNLGVTAQPTLLPTIPPPVPPSAWVVAQSQTVEGVTMTLDWVYLDSTRLLFGIHYSKLPADVSVGFPAVTVNGQVPGKDRQPSKFLRSTNSQAIYLSNQITQSSPLEKTVALEIAIPLLRNEDRTETQVAAFHFSLPDVPSYAGQTLNFHQTVAASVNGVEIQLHSMRLTPLSVDAVICPSPLSSAAFSVQQATLSGDGFGKREFTSRQTVEDQGTACQKVSFEPQGLEENHQITLTVNKDWKFDIDLPTEDRIPGVKELPPPPSPELLAAQAIDQVTMTLDWVFVDAKRIAFGYTISGLPDLPEAAILGGTIAVSDGQGNPYSSGYGGSSTLQRSEDRPGELTGTWSMFLPNPLAEDQITLNIDITLDGTHGNDWNYIIGNIIYPISGPTDETIGSIPLVIPTGLVGTYHFEITTRVYPVTILQPGQAIEAHGIPMELVQAELTPSFSSFIVCYNKPTAADWMVSGEAYMLSGIEQTSIGGYSLLRDSQFVMKNPVELPSTSIGGENFRCAKVDFNLGHSNQERTITLTIPALERSSPEVFPQSELDAAYAKLKEQGIEMTYITMRGGGGGGGTWQYTKLPEGMTEEEAYARLIDALGYRTPGPWVFTLKYQP